MGVPAGPWYIDDTLTFTVTTIRVDTGVITDADAVPAYRIYEDETGTAILTGNMAKLDDANTTGFYSEQITLSAANGFEVGKSYAIYVSAAVNSVTGGQTFNFKVIAAVSTAPTAAAVADAVWDEAQADHVAAGSFGEVATETAAILVDTAEIGVAGAGLTAINLPDQTMNITGNITGNLTGSVGSVATGGITAASFGAGAIDAAALAADAGTEIGTAVWATAARTLTAIDEDSTTLDLDATVRAAVGMASANLDTQLDALPTAAENATAVLTTQMTESYAANGTAPTLAQGMFAVHQILMQHAISGTTWTAYKLDNVTVAFTVTLNDATTPTSARRT